MAMRLIEVFVPKASEADVPELLGDREVLGLWRQPCEDDRSCVGVLLQAEQTEQVLDLLEERFSSAEGFRIVVLPVEATLPRPEPEDEERREEEQKEEAAEKKAPLGIGISREELYTDVAEGAEITGVYMVGVVLSTIVAAVGLMHDDVAVIIGAMVIAPLLGPNVALALATTLGDLALAARSLKTAGAGLLAAFALSLGLGLVLPVDPTMPEIAARTRVGIGDIAVALASGCAGVLAFTAGTSVALVGVMVAVALLPPLVTLGLVLACGQPDQALGALLLLSTNLICVNLAGVVTFLARGIRPRTWWETERARRATRIATVLWLVLLGVLVMVILLSQGK
jgi:uncharacterized hydrophobic protein (TIGR00341 family)